MSPLINYERAVDDLASDIFETASTKGFWDYEDVGNDGLIPLKLVLIHSEVTEALDVHRKGYDDELADPVTGLTPMQEDDFLEELADVIIRTLDLAGSFDTGRFGEIVVAKMEKNRNRPFRHGKRY